MRKKERKKKKNVQKTKREKEKHIQKFLRVLDVYLLSRACSIGSTRYGRGVVSPVLFPHSLFVCVNTESCPTFPGALFTLAAPSFCVPVGTPWPCSLCLALWSVGLWGALLLQKPLSVHLRLSQPSQPRRFPDHPELCAECGSGVWEAVSQYQHFQTQPSTNRMWPAFSPQKVRHLSPLCHSWPWAWTSQEVYF